MANQNNIVHPIAWRNPQKSGHRQEDDSIRSELARGRILLLVESTGNHRQLAELLAQRYNIVETDCEKLPVEDFDLAVVDGPGFRRWHEQLAAAKNYQQPVFLPLMLMLPRRDLRRHNSSYWDLVDEFIVAPIERMELLERVAMLLRTRHLAKEQQEDLAHLITHDSMTGLPNQRLFMDRLGTAIADASITGQRFHTVVILVPMERVMASLGHEALQKAVQVCTVRFQRAIGAESSLARLTTQEWGILVKAEKTVDDVTDLCRRLGQCLAEPIKMGRESVHFDAYLGVSTYPDDATSAEELLNVTLSAVSRAEVPGEPYFFSREVQSYALRYIRTEAKLHDALERNQFELWFQPQFRMEDRTINGAEALIRWRLPSGELVSPGDFIPIAESSGLIKRMDRWVIEEACKTLRGWRDAYDWELSVAVNLTPADLAESDFVSWVKNYIEQFELNPAWLELELTETMFCNIDESILEKLNDLRKFGISVAIDDFGTGYSSLSYLHQLPINILKLDRSFVSCVPGNKQSEGISEAIIGLARRFGLEIIAEGIETEDQLSYLNRFGVQTGQGFLVGRPMPDAEFRRFCEESFSANSKAG